MAVALSSLSKGVSRPPLGELTRLPRARTGTTSASARLARWLGARPRGERPLLFPTARGGRRDKDNINKRVLKPVLERADELLADRRQHTLPRGVTPHKLRHMYASVLIALGRDPRYVTEQLGHTDPKFTLRVYAHAMRFSDEDRARLKAFAEGGVLAPIATEPSAGLTPKLESLVGAAGFEPATLACEE